MAAAKKDSQTEIKLDALMNDDTIEVKYAYLHQSITWPGVSGSEKTISDQRIKGVKMYVTTHGLMLLSKGKKCLIPHANVANYVLA